MGGLSGCDFHGELIRSLLLWATVLGYGLRFWLDLDLAIKRSYALGPGYESQAAELVLPRS